MRLLVCGGRDFRFGPMTEKAFYGFCAKHGVSEVIHGDYDGADREAAALAEHAGLKAIPFPADWTKFGLAAGPIRNQRMLDEGKPALVLACPGGRGTADMIQRARKAGVPVHYLMAQLVEKPVNEVSQ